METLMGMWWHSWFRHCTASLVQIPVGPLGFFTDLILQPHYGPGVNCASNRNEYKGYLLGVNVASA